MPFPQGGDFSRSVQSVFKVINADQRICIHDNGTNVCDMGHKLKFPGTCLNQALGTFNSTDPTFQPTFPICETDYSSSGFHPGIIFATEEVEGNGAIFSNDSDVNTSYPLYELSPVVERQHPIYKLLRTVTSSYVLADVASVISNSINEAAVFPGAVSYYKIGQFSPGLVPHLPGVTSELFDYDVFSSYTYYNKLVVHFLNSIYSISQKELPESYKNLVHYDPVIVAEVDICEGDGTPPDITYHDPTASGTFLRPQNQIVDFSLSDAIGGVDLSSIDVSLSSQTVGNINLIEAGVDQTGGRVSIVGDSSSYRIRYTPNFTWNYNDTVVVTISGSDLPPIVDGDPFFCEGSGVNFFGGDIRFQVLNYNDFGASIVAEGDTTPPFIVSVSPASGTIGNSVFAPIIIQLSDDFTGIDLGSLSVFVNGAPIIVEGVANSETIISGNPLNYTITYNHTDAFDYGSIVEVSLTVADRANPPNLYSTTYTYSCIDSGTLHISNFLPPVGTSVNPHDLDISVDLTDDLYGIDEDQSFLVVNGAIVSGTITTITSGINFTYHPPNDFAYHEPIVVKVHAVNDHPSAPVVREDIYTLYYGYRLLLHRGGPYEPEQQVDVFVRARNLENLHKDLSTGYLFTSYTQPRSDMGAFIQAINPVLNIPASINGVGPEHRRGATVVVSFYVEDFDGHALGPYTFSYTLED